MFQVLVELSPRIHCIAKFKAVIYIGLLLWYYTHFKDDTVLTFLHFGLELQNVLEKKGDGAAEVELQRLQSLRAGVLMREQLLLFEHLTRASRSALSCHMCFSQQPQELDAIIFNPT